jgi:hypothetical protein
MYGGVKLRTVASNGVASSTDRRARARVRSQAARRVEDAPWAGLSSQGEGLHTTKHSIDQRLGESPTDGLKTNVFRRTKQLQTLTTKDVPDACPLKHERGFQRPRLEITPLFVCF